MRLLPALLIALAACGGSDKDDTNGSPTDTGSGATGSTTGNPGGTTGNSDRTATVNGTILDCAGNDLGGVDIRFCDFQNCRYHTTEPGNGAFTFPNTLVGWNSLEAVGPSGTGYVPLQLADQETRDLTITLCPFDPATPLTGTATEIALGDGLLVTLSTSLLEPPLFIDPATEAAGLLLDPAHHVPMDGITGTVAAQWFVEPFNHTAASGELAVRFDGAAIGLAGTVYRGWVGSYDDYGWLDLGTFSDGDADGYYTSDSGQGLPLLGTVALVEE